MQNKLTWKTIIDGVVFEASILIYFKIYLFSYLILNTSCLLIRKPFFLPPPYLLYRESGNQSLGQSDGHFPGFRHRVPETETQSPLYGPSISRPWHGDCRSPQLRPEAVCDFDYSCWLQFSTAWQLLMFCFSKRMQLLVAARQRTCGCLLMFSQALQQLTFW